MSTDTNPKLKTLYWAVKLLECFDQDNGRLSVTELSRRMNIPKSTVCNALATFELLGYVRKHGATGKYSLGPKVICLTHAFQTTNSDAQAFYHECRNLCDRTGFIVQVGVKIDSRLVCMSSASPAFYQSPAGVGSGIRFCSTALGKSILAFAEEKDQREILELGLPAVTARTVTDPERLFREFEVIRKRGYATEICENEEGICSVAVPIWKDTEHRIPPKYSMSISVPAENMTEEQIMSYVKLIRDSEKEISRLVAMDEVLR